MNKLTVYRILGLPKSIYFNFKYLPFKQAKKLPFRFGTGVKMEIDKTARIILDTDDVKPGMVQMGIGYGSYRRGEKMSSSLIMRENSELMIKGQAIFQRGGYIQIEKDARIEMGHHFNANSYFVMTTDYEIKFGEWAFLGWNNTIMGTDGHDIIDATTGEVVNDKKSIIFGNHIWLCSEAHVLKGAEIADGCIVGYGSLVTGKHTTPNTLIVGRPAKDVAYNRTWRP